MFNRKCHPKRSEAAVVAAFLLLPAVAPGPALAGLDVFDGYWRGEGSATLTDGGSENVRCSGTISVRNGGTSLAFSMQCASSGPSVSLNSNLQVDGGSVQGSWSSSTGESGYASGSAGSSSLNLSLSGSDGGASLSLSASSCQQHVRLNGPIGEVRRLRVTMNKDC